MTEKKKKQKNKIHKLNINLFQSNPLIKGEVMMKIRKTFVLNNIENVT